MAGRCSGKRESYASSSGAVALQVGKVVATCVRHCLWLSELWRQLCPGCPSGVKVVSQVACRCIELSIGCREIVPVVPELRSIWVGVVITWVAGARVVGGNRW